MNFSLFLFCFAALICSCAYASKINPKKKKVLICGVCKDVAGAIRNAIENIEETGKHFEDYAVIIYENNSSDDTAKILEEWSRRNNRVVFITEKLSKEELSEGALSFDYLGVPSREERIARARNIVLSYARDEKYNDYEYLIMADLDFRNPWPIDAILKSIKLKIEWDCIAANGVTRKGAYHDRYAFRNKEFPFGPELLGEEWWKEKVRTMFTLKGKIVPVYSAFGGLAIYKRKTLIQFRYTGCVNEDLRQDYQRIVQILPKDLPQLQKYLKLHNLSHMNDLAKIPVIFGLCCGSFKLQACCEHVTLHAAMRLNGYDKIFINPQLKMQY